MAQTNINTGPGTQSTLLGDFKERYAPKWQTLFEQASPLTKRFLFQAGTAVGNKYHQPVDVANEQGFTQAAQGVLPTSATYVQPLAGQSQDAQVTPYQIHGRAAVAYEAEYSSLSGAQAFLDANKLVMKRLTLGAAKRHEWGIINGQEGWLKSDGTTIATGATRTFIGTADTFAAGAFIGAIGMPVQLFLDSGGSPTGSGLFTNATASANDLPYISAVNYDTHTLTITVPNTSDQSVALTSTYWVFPWIPSYTSEMPGLGKISSNTGSLFNVDASVYPEWAGNIFSSVGILDIAKVLEVHGQMAPWFPMLGMKTLTIIPPKAFEVLNTDQAALRQYDVSYTDQAKNGFQGMRFNTQVGTTELIAHPMCRNSRAHVCVEEETIRIGATEHTFITRGKSGDVLVVESSNSPAGEMRDFISLALFCEAPRHTAILSGLTY